jgi:hypothetical protein
MKLKTKIPFSGFYYSIHSEILDYELNWITSDTDSSMSKKELESLEDKINWEDVHIAYVQKYLDVFKYDTELFSLKFIKLWSPKYYNYETDEIIAEIDFLDVKKMRRAVTTESLRKAIKARHSSCDGFISHYPNDLDLWEKSLSKWDMNQIHTLMHCYLETLNNEFEYRIAEHLTDNAYEMILNNLNN